MSPLQRSNNLAARMGRWSADHRRPPSSAGPRSSSPPSPSATAVGMKEIDFGRAPRREAGRAQEILDDAGFGSANGDETSSSQSEPATVADPPAFRAAVEDAVRTVSGFAVVRDVESPLAPGNEGQVAADGRSALVTFRSRGERRRRRRDRPDRRRGGRDRRAATTASSSPRRAPPAPAKAVDEFFAKDLEKAGMLARSPSRSSSCSSPSAHSSRRAFRSSSESPRSLATMGLIALPSQFVPMDASGSTRCPARRPRRRRRLLALLPPPRARGAGGRQGPRGGPRGGRGHVRTRRAHLRAHGDGRDGRHVLHRRRGLRRRSASRRCWSSPSPCSARSRSCRRCSHRSATASSRAVSRSSGGAQPDGSAAFWNAILDRVLAGRSSPRARVGGTAAASRSPRSADAQRSPAWTGSRATLELVATYEIQEAFPGGPLPADRGRQGRRPEAPEVAAAFARAPRARPGHRADARSDRRST